MGNKLLNKAITISAKEEKLQGNKPVMKVKDEKGLTYTVYKTKQDGSISVAWEQIQELSVGDTVQIGYVEDLGEYQGKTVTYRTIRNFNKDIGEGMKNYQSNTGSQSSESPRSGQSGASQRESSEAFGKRLAIHGMVNGLLASGKTPVEIADQWLDEIVALEDVIEKKLNPSPLRQAVEATNPEFFKEEIPTIQ